MYQRFRLRMVQTFGSLASALYEFGVDPESGRISREDFEHVVAGRLNLVSSTEANLLFSHITNADVLDGGLGGHATYRHFNITDEEWQYVVSSKKQAEGGNSTGFQPFRSSPRGSSAGFFHRPIRVKDVEGQSVSVEQPSKESSGFGVEDAPPSKHLQDGSISKGLSTERGRPLPWRQKQQPWSPSMLAGTGFPEACANTKPRWRPCDFTFRTTGPSALFASPRRHQGLRESFIQRNGENGLPAFACPPRRSEMKPRLCAEQVEAWWPYLQKKPPFRLQIPRRRQQAPDILLLST